MMPDLHVLWLRGLGKYVHEIRVVRYGRRVSTKPVEKNTRKKYYCELRERDSPRLLYVCIRARES